MADYTSKFTGSEIDGILDEAIELPSVEDLTGNNLLQYDSNSGSVAWQDPTQIVDNVLANVEGANSGYVLKYANDTNHLYWEAEYSIDTSEADDGDVLKYSSSTGIYWDSIPALPNTSGLNGEHILICADNGAQINWVSTTDTSSLDLYGLRILPTYNTNDDAGKVLMITANGPEWVTLQ